MWGKYNIPTKSILILVVVIIQMLHYILLNDTNTRIKIIFLDLEVLVKRNYYFIVPPGEIYLN